MRCVPSVSMPFDASYISDPYTAVERLRRDAAVHRVTSPEGQPMWLITGYAGPSIRTHGLRSLPVFLS